MKIKIRLATLSDLNKLMGIFDTARRFMQSTGNANQWINGYPQRELIMHEINSGHCYVCINEQESVAGTFCFIQGPDPTYSRIDTKEIGWIMILIGLSTVLPQMVAVEVYSKHA